MATLHKTDGSQWWPWAPCAFTAGETSEVHGPAAPTPKKRISSWHMARTWRKTKGASQPRPARRWLRAGPPQRSWSARPAPGPCGWKGFATRRVFANTKLEKQQNAPASNLPTLPPERWRRSDLCSTAAAPPWCLRNVWTWSGRAQKLKGTRSANPPPAAGTLPRSAV